MGEKQQKNMLMPSVVEKGNRVKGYDGIISPNGDFYKVSKRNSFEFKQNKFAELFSSVILGKDIYEEWENFKEGKEEFNGIYLSPLDILINLYGFVNYEYVDTKIKVTAPCPLYKDLDITEQQVDTLAKLVLINSDKVYKIEETKPIEELRKNSVFWKKIKGE